MGIQSVIISFVYHTFEPFFDAYLLLEVIQK